MPYFDGVYYGGIDRGSPLLLYAADGTSLVLSPLKNFAVSEQTMTTRFAGSTIPLTRGSAAAAAGAAVFAAGLNGLTNNIPAGFVHEVLAHASADGLNAAMHGWGSLLLKRGSKQRPNPANDFVLSNLGYWTDRGSYLYGNPAGCNTSSLPPQLPPSLSSLSSSPSPPPPSPPGKCSMEQAIKHVLATTKAQGIPFKYHQLDDWWFQQDNGDFGGMVEWAACHDGLAKGWATDTSCREKGPATFPSGGLGWLPGPKALYMGLVSNETVVLDQYDFLVDGQWAVPIDAQFWKDLFKNGTENGMVMFEQDFLSFYFGALGSGPTNVTLGNLTAAADFFGAQDEAAMAGYNARWSTHLNSLGGTGWARCSPRQEGCSVASSLCSWWKPAVV